MARHDAPRKSYPITGRFVRDLVGRDTGGKWATLEQAKNFDVTQIRPLHDEEHYVVYRRQIWT